MLKLLYLWKNDVSKASSLKKFLAKAIAGTFGLKVVNAGLLYVNSLFLARLLGANGFGLYSYAGAWAYLLLIPAALGLEGLILRETAIYRTKAQWSLARGLLSWSNLIVLLNSIMIALVTALGFWLVAPEQNPEILAVMVIAMITLPFDAVSRLRQPAMRAIDKIVAGELPETLIRPATLSLLLAAAVFIFQQEITPLDAMIFRGVAIAVTCIAGTILLKSYLPSQIKTTVATYKPKIWLASSFPMLLIGSMYVVNNYTDTIMLGILSNPEAVGIYTIANRGSGLITFILVAFDTALAPTFASLYAQADLRQLQTIVTQSCRLAFAVALFVAGTLIFFGHWLLLLFGSEFTQGQLVLSLLSIGQLCNAFTGSVALLLMMTGLEKQTAIGVSCSAMINIILNTALIPNWGAEGAAIATTISTIVWNIILVSFAAQKLKINSIPLGKIF